MKLRDLINSTKKARMRQRPTRRLGAVSFNYVPRTKILYISAQCFPLDRKSRNSPYKVSLALKGVSNSDEKDKKHTFPYSQDGKNIERWLELPTVNMDTMARCQCPDYYFMWQYYNKGVKSLIGPHKPYIRKTKHYPPRNPEKLPGLCKHQLMLVKWLFDNNIIKRNVKSIQYVNRKPREV